MADHIQVALHLLGMPRYRRGLRHGDAHVQPDLGV